MAEENVEYAALLAENTALRARVIDQDHEIFSLTFDEINRKDEQDALREENESLKSTIARLERKLEKAEQENSGSHDKKRFNSREKGTLQTILYAVIKLTHGVFPPAGFSKKLETFLQLNFPEFAVSEKTIRNKFNDISEMIAERRQ